jgi:hypothetical protein
MNLQKISLHGSVKVNLLYNKSQLIKYAWFGSSLTAQYNSLSMLLSSFMQKVVPSRHVCIVFYRKQPIAECSNSAVHP